MIHQVFSHTLTSFKTLDFRPGFNLLVAEKTQGASTQQTRNCAGKSSFVELVHFALGSAVRKSSIFRTAALQEHSFGMAFDLAGSRTEVERSGARQNQIVIREAETARWPIPVEPPNLFQPPSIGVSRWTEVLGELAYRMRTDWPTYSPTFRMVFPYFARQRIREPKYQDDGFLDPRSFSIKQQEWQKQVALSWLLGLDWRIAQEFEGVHQKEKSLKTLKKELNSGVFQSVIGTSAQLRSRLTLTEQRLQKLEKELAEFRVLPEYHELEREAASIAVSIAGLSNENTLAQESLDRLRQSLATETPPAADDVLRVYGEAGVVLAAGTAKRLEDVRIFHEAVIRNRQAHLQADIQKLESQIAARRDEMARRDGRRREIMEVLKVHGALDQHTKLQGELTRLRTEVEELRRHQQIAERVETSQTDLKLDRTQLHKRLQVDHREQEARIKEAILLFEHFSRSLCEHEGRLAINATEHGPEFDIQVEGYRGKGIQQMQIFCFDLMLTVLLTRRGLGLGFLIHDSHLFDGMDSRQIGLALQIGARTAEEHGFQYIVTLNSDTLELPDVRTLFNPEPYLLRVRLTDATQTGGLFGFRFD